MKYLPSPRSITAYGLYGDDGKPVAIIEFEPSANYIELIRLIASASALLAALEQTTAALEYLFAREGYPPDASQEMMQAARSAIAQARGE